MKPLRLLYRGSVLASGFVFYGAASRPRNTRRAQEQIAALYSPGVRLFADQDDWILFLPEPIRIRAESAPGAPFILEEGRYLATPLSMQGPLTEFAPGSVSRYCRGELRTIDPQRDATPVDLSGWLELPAFRIIEARFPKLPATETEIVQAASKKPHEVLGIRRAPDFWTLLKGLRRSGVPVEVGGIVGGLLSGATRLLRFANRLRAKVQEQAGPANTTSENIKRIGDSPKKRRSIWPAIVERLDFLNLFGLMHSAYLKRVLAMFERGDLENALRHAPGRSSGDASAATSFGGFGPRASLDLFTRGGVAIGSISDRLAAALQQRYEQALERLLREGRWKEAAFVLAELLDEAERAVALLEEHGMLEEAARTAEARDLPAGLVVRLWFLAGDQERAVAQAILHGAFSDAVTRLERAAEIEQSQVLRSLWADRLVAAGAYAKAAEVIRNTGDDIRLREVLDLGVAVGGRPGARALARRLIFTENEEGAAALLASEHASILLEELLKFPKEGGTIAGAYSRKAARLIAAGELSGPFEKLAERSFDRAFREDLRRLKPKSVETRREFDGSDYYSDADGILPVHDAVALPDGRLLIASGEQGVRLSDATGRPLAVFDCPAERLVLADSGARALALARAGTDARLTRLDLSQRVARSWCVAQLEHHCDGYDGNVWFVADQRRVHAIDVQSPGFRSLWSVEMETRDLLRQPGWLECLALPPDSFSEQVACYELYRYALPDLRLADRITAKSKSGRRYAPGYALGSGGVLFFTPGAPGEVAAGSDLIPHSALEIAGESSIWKTDRLEAKSEQCLRILALAVGDHELALAGEFASAPDANGDYKIRRMVLHFDTTGAINKRIEIANLRADDQESPIGLRWSGPILTIAVRDGRVLTYDRRTGAVFAIAPE
ncbi:MAG: bpX6 domain-containing protein [bacterium]|nr:bpX6 domain-containing protein [bacterium]